MRHWFHEKRAGDIIKDIIFIVKYDLATLVKSNLDILSNCVYETKIFHSLALFG